MFQNVQMFENFKNAIDLANKLIEKMKIEKLNSLMNILRDLQDNLKLIEIELKINDNDTELKRNKIYYLNEINKIIDKIEKLAGKSWKKIQQQEEERRKIQNFKIDSIDDLIKIDDNDLIFDYYNFNSNSLINIDKNNKIKNIYYNYNENNQILLNKNNVLIDIPTEKEAQKLLNCYYLHQLTFKKLMLLDVKCFMFLLNVGYNENIDLMNNQQMKKMLTIIFKYDCNNIEIDLLNDLYDEHENDDFNKIMMIDFIKKINKTYFKLKIEDKNEIIIFNNNLNNFDGMNIINIINKYYLFNIFNKNYNFNNFEFEFNGKFKNLINIIKHMKEIRDEPNQLNSLIRYMRYNLNNLKYIIDLFYDSANHKNEHSLFNLIIEKYEFNELIKYYFPNNQTFIKLILYYYLINDLKNNDLNDDYNKNDLIDLINDFKNIFKKLNSFKGYDSDFINIDYIDYIDDSNKKFMFDVLNYLFNNDIINYYKNFKYEDN